MRILTTARPNQRYHWYLNFASITLEARLINNNIIYYEIDAGQERRIAEDIVKQLFPAGCSISDQPFLIRENKDFYTVLYRHRKHYQERFQKIKSKS